MLKRPIVSLFHSLKSNRKRYYWVPPDSPEYNKLFSIKEKYNILNNNFTTLQEFNKMQNIIKLQETNIILLNNELTNQKKVIEEIYNGVKIMIFGSYSLFVFNLTHSLLFPDTFLILDNIV